MHIFSHMISENGKYIISGGFDKSILIWSI